MLLTASAVAAVVTVLVIRLATADPTAGDDGPQEETAAWVELVRWADAELPTGTPLLVADDLLADARAAGDDERLQPLDAEIADTGLLVTSGEAPPGSVEVVRFGQPDASALVVSDPLPGRPTPEELERRQRLSAAVLANPNTGASGRAAQLLQVAQVDPRLLGLLAALVTQLGVGVADFPPAAGEPGDGVLARTVLLDRVGTEPLAAGQAVTSRLLTFVDVQITPFAPDRVEVTDDGVLIGFRYQSAPDALVTDRAP